ncbi:MAG: SAM-dependent methyltransferase [Candidatus Woesearchaeota archaeon]|jgi:ribosome biogenesis SPOUT family RNA methylase Rps3|nr:SAM-dependent methyltransferase [Candidatus Woesearchaeota archaeon]
MIQFIIEHLEPKLSKWCLIEYQQIASTAGKNVMFTNIKRATNNFPGKTEKKSVSDLKLKNACLLDPRAKKTLSKNDNFDYLIFGGILGDDPPRDRTSLIRLKCKKRNLGKEQMSTDTAVLVAKKIVEGTNLKDLDFIDELEIDLVENESVILPFRYLVENGKPVIAEKLVDYLKKKRSF